MNDNPSAELHVFPSFFSALISSLPNSTAYFSILDMIILNKNQNIVTSQELLESINKVSNDIYEIEIAHELYQLKEKFGIPLSSFVSGENKYSYSDVVSNILKELSKLMNSRGEISHSDLPSVFNFVLPGAKINFENIALHGEIPRPYEKILESISSVRRVIPTDKNKKITKYSFPDYTTENHFILDVILQNPGKKIGISVPDEYSIVSISNLLKASGLNPSIASQISIYTLGSFPINLIKNLLTIASGNGTAENFYSLIHDPFNSRLESKLYDIKKKAFENSIIDDFDDWIELLTDFGMDNVVSLIKRLKNHIHEKGDRLDVIPIIQTLENFFMSYIPEHFQTLQSIDQKINFFIDKVSSLNDLLSLYEIVLRLSKSPVVIGDAKIIIGTPFDISGIDFDISIVARCDSTSISRITLPEIFNFIQITGLTETINQLLDQYNKSIIRGSSKSYILYSSLDERSRYTASVDFFDSMPGDPIKVDRVSSISRRKIVVSSAFTQINKRDIYHVTGRTLDILKADFSPTSLENYLICPFKYFIENVIGYRKLDETTEFLGIMEMGTITHKLLELYHDIETDPKTFRIKAENEIKKMIEGSKYKSKRKALELYLSKYLKENRLPKFVEIDTREAKELGRHIFKKEFRFNGRNQNILLEINDLKIPIKGVVDRIDENRDGTLTVIDYKGSLSKFPNDKLCNEHSIQLYVYKYAVEKAFNKKVTAAAYLSYRDYSDGATTKKGHFRVIPPGDEQREVMECQSIIYSGLNKLTSGDFFVQRENNENLSVCRDARCTFYNICRVQELRW